MSIIINKPRYVFLKNKNSVLFQFDYLNPRYLWPRGWIPSV